MNVIDTPGKMAHADAMSRAIRNRIYPLGPGWAELSDSQKEDWERMARVKITKVEKMKETMRKVFYVWGFIGCLMFIARMITGTLPGTPFWK